MELVLVSVLKIEVFSEAPALSLLLVIVVVDLLADEPSAVTAVELTDTNAVAFSAVEPSEELTVPALVFTELEAAKVFAVTDALFAVTAKVVSSVLIDAVVALFVFTGVMF